LVEWNKDIAVYILADFAFLNAVCRNISGAFQLSSHCRVGLIVLLSNAAKTLSATLAAQILADNHDLFETSTDYLFEGGMQFHMLSLCQ
jgi:hypothetical protein